MSNQKVRVGIIGVGNCASSLVQGVTYYKNADEMQFVNIANPGILRDIDFREDLTKTQTEIN